MLALTACGAVAASVLLGSLPPVRRKPAPTGRDPPPQEACRCPATSAGPVRGRLMTATTLPTIDRRLNSVSRRSPPASPTSRRPASTAAERRSAERSSRRRARRRRVAGPSSPTATPRRASSRNAPRRCRRTCSGLSAVVSELVKAGYVVTLPDYQGLGVARLLPPVPRRHHRRTEPHRRGARGAQAGPAASDRWLGIGVSQGGQATWAANELAPTYGAGLTLEGTVSVDAALRSHGVRRRRRQRHAGQGAGASVRVRPRLR